jgi:hypothetical protein
MKLTSMKTKLSSVANVSAAKGQWGEVSGLVRSLPDDSSWLLARAALGESIDRLVSFLEGLKPRSAWILFS